MDYHKDVWSTPHNPFNSFKVLLWRKHLEGMASGKLLPPVTVDFDPTNKCNSNCTWCNSAMFRKQHPGSMTTEHMLDLAEFLGEWGIKSACVAGGGEPMLNPGTAELLYKMKEVGIKTGVITNGISMTEEQRNAIVDCSSWCGFSVDAGNADDFNKVHRVDEFDDVINNLTELVKLKKEKKSDVELTYKYLVHPDNSSSIYEGAKLAKSIGLDMFHARPVCWDNLYDRLPREPIDFESVMDTVTKQLSISEGLTDDNFKFYGVRHKFGERLERVVRFEKCRATSIMAVYCADGTVQLCHDLRGKKEWVLCRHDNPREILSVWGSKRHLGMIDSIDPHECPRCTFQVYNEIIEKDILNDSMFRDFP